MKRWIVGCVLLTLVAGCSIWDDTFGLGRESSEVIEPPKAATDSTAAAAIEDPATPATPAATQPSAQTNPHEGHELTGRPMVVEAVALTVNDQIITVSEVLHSVHRPLGAAGHASLDEFAAKAQEIITQEIQRQIGEALLVERATAELNEPQLAYVDRLVDERIRDMILAHGGSQTKLEQALEADGATLDAARTTFRRRMLSRLYVQIQLGDQSQASRRDLWRYYQANRSEFSRPAKVKMQILAFPFKAMIPETVTVATAADVQRATEQAKAGAAAALAKIKAGADFTTVVTEESKTSAFRSTHGGIWDFMPAGSFRESAVEDAAFSMQAGQVSDVIVGETAAFVVKTLARQDGQVLSFEQAQEQIAKTLMDKQYQRLSRQYDEELRRRAVIVEAEAFEKFAMDRAIGLYYRGDEER